MIGGSGSDSYDVDNLGDVVIEAPGGGIDSIKTSLTTYTLPANFENLSLTSTANGVTGIGIADAHPLVLSGHGDFVFA